MSDVAEVMAVMAQAQKAEGTVFTDPLFEAFKEQYENVYDLALFCLALNIAPSEAKLMTEFEKAVFIEAFKELNPRKRGH